MTTPPRPIAAELTWTGERFEEGIAVTPGPDGRIAAVGPAATCAEPVRPLPGIALLPGFVNAHSHAFQRGLRGRVESFPAGVGSFWSWRPTMYELAGEVTADRLFDLSRQAFDEMRGAGITCVGEFHFLHHLGEGRDFAGDEVVRAAAAEVGIRLVLLLAYYRTGGVGRPLEGPQRRFETPSLEAYWRQVDRLAGTLEPRTQSLGTVAHSLRAATPSEVFALVREARRRALVLHLHLEEQRRELRECLAGYGRTPMAILLDGLDGFEGITAVHCTHTVERELERFVAGGGKVCVCPLTEANLGDGLPALPGPRGLCLGTDSNTRISMLEEMRWLEYGQRLRQEGRGELRDEAGEVAPVLLAAASEGGADALGIEAGRIAPGRWADLVAVDLTAPCLTGTGAVELLPALVFGAGDGVVAGSCVGGRWRWEEGHFRAGRRLSAGPPELP